MPILTLIVLPLVVPASSSEFPPGTVSSEQYGVNEQTSDETSMFFVLLSIVLFRIVIVGQKAKLCRNVTLAGFRVCLRPPA
jgi:hypothetical protein